MLDYVKVGAELRHAEGVQRKMCRRRATKKNSERTQREKLAA
jgi:hypothetical protein